MYSNSTSGFRRLLAILLPIVVLIFGLVCLVITVMHTNAKAIALHFPPSKQGDSFISLTHKTTKTDPVTETNSANKENSETSSAAEHESKPTNNLVMLFSALSALAALIELAIIAFYTTRAQKISTMTNAN